MAWTDICAVVDINASNPAGRLLRGRGSAPAPKPFPSTSVRGDVEERATALSETRIRVKNLARPNAHEAIALFCGRSSRGTLFLPEYAPAWHRRRTPQ